jgi:hypothetical protein
MGGYSFSLLFQVYSLLCGRSAAGRSGLTCTYGLGPASPFSSPLYQWRIGSPFSDGLAPARLFALSCLHLTFNRFVVSVVLVALFGEGVQGRASFPPCWSVPCHCFDLVFVYRLESLSRL